MVYLKHGTGLKIPNMNKKITNYNSIFKFEKKLSLYTGAPFVVATDGCTHAMEIVLKYYNIKKCELTAFTYISVIQMLKQCKIDYKLLEESWLGEYKLHGTNIWDSARRLEPNMFRKGQIQCLSFGATKPLQIGKVGAILLDDKKAYIELSKIRSDGRNLTVHPWIKQKKFYCGYHYCPTLEDCQKGINLLQKVKPQKQKYFYPDCRKIKIYEDIKIDN
jgi:dTDP-4-amino-4,6-dideoxygalactose transaminase